MGSALTMNTASNNPTELKTLALVSASPALSEDITYALSASQPEAR